MPIQVLLATLVLWRKGLRGASLRGVRAGGGCRKGWGRAVHGGDAKSWGLQPGLSQMGNRTGTGSASVMAGETQIGLFHLSSGLWGLPRSLTWCCTTPECSLHAVTSAVATTSPRRVPLLSATTG